MVTGMGILVWYVFFCFLVWGEDGRLANLLVISYIVWFENRRDRIRSDLLGWVAAV